MFLITFFESDFESHFESLFSRFFEIYKKSRFFECLGEVK